MHIDHTDHIRLSLLLHLYQHPVLILPLCPLIRMSLLHPPQGLQNSNHPGQFPIKSSRQHLRATIQTLQLPVPPYQSQLLVFLPPRSFKPNNQNHSRKNNMAFLTLLQLNRCLHLHQPIFHPL